MEGSEIRVRDEFKWFDFEFCKPMAQLEPLVCLISFFFLQAKYFFRSCKLIITIENIFMVPTGGYCSDYKCKSF